MDNSLTEQLIGLVLRNDKEAHKFEDALNDHRASIIDRAKQSVVINDEYGNSLLAVGNKDKVDQFNNYTFENDTLNWALWLALYNDSWVFRRAIDKPAQDMVRAGVSLSGEGDKTNVYRLLKAHRDNFIQLLQWGALFGGSVACMMFDNVKEEEYAKAMRVDQLRKSKKMTMYITDRWYGLQPSPNTVTNMRDIDYGKPASYKVTLANGHQVKFHHSWVLRYEHRNAPPFIKRGMLQNWGYAEGAHIINELCRDEKLKSSIQSLVNKALIEVIKMDGMRGIFMGADKENQEQLKKRLEMVNWGRDFNSLTFLDTNDEYQMNGFSGLAGLADILQQNMWLISSALEMQGVLFGDLKNGFSVDSTALERYDDTINGRCETYLRPVYEKFLRVCYNMLGIRESVEFTFNSLLTREKTEKQVEDLGRFQTLCSSMLSDGIITPVQYAKAMQTYAANGTIDFGFDDDAYAKLEEIDVNEDFDLGSIKNEGNANGTKKIV